MLTWRDDSHLSVGDTRFLLVAWGGAQSDERRFILCKSRDMVERLSDLVETLQPRNVFELGIFQGGSTALLASIAPVEKLVAVDIEAPVTALDDHLDRTGLGARVRTYYGVDQGDEAQLRTILDDEFGDRALDLVVDDASHMLDETRRSFNVLFPRVRPGGYYVIEDWNWAHGEGPGLWPERTPLTVLILELLLANASGTGVVDELVLHDGVAYIRRGEAVLDASFDIAAASDERGRRLLAGS